MPRKVQAGDPFDRSASTHNAFVEAARSVTETPTSEDTGDAARPHTIRVKNTEGQPMLRGVVVSFGDPIGNPESGEANFASTLIFRAGRWSDATPDDANMGITTAPIPTNAIGEVVVSGVVYGRDLEVRSEGDRRASGGSGGRLISNANGKSLIVWKGDELDDGRTPCVVIITGEVGSSPRFARITGHESIGTNRWAYRYEVVDFFPPLLDGFGNISEPGFWDLANQFDPDTHDTLGFAFNTMEAENTEFGTQPIGVNISGLPGSFTIKPIGIGAIVQIQRPPFNVQAGLFGQGSDTPVQIFTMPNAIDGAC